MKYSLTLFICFLALAVNAQNLSWKKHSKMADKLFEEGKYASAAEHYEAAWKKKQSKKDLIYKAGECYYAMKDFRKAATAFERIKDESGEVALAGLKYARSLKQDGQYELARKELLSYNKRYKGDDKKVVSKIVKREIEGCDLGLSLDPADNKSIVVEHLSESINTLEEEFAPIPFSDAILYFSSTMSGDAKMYRSQRQSGVWTRAAVPELPQVASGQICHGTFTPDNQRFYFTVCQTNGNWNGNKTACDIYVTRMEDSGWSPAERLRDYIRMDGSTATHPFVVHTDTEEILYFASDREGGYGGLDIWYTKRQLSVNDVDFSLPRNAGPRVNTLGDEITPFYNQVEQTLYFSSNGHVTLGGHDIFKAKDLGGRFDKPVNLGLPMNSSNDDYNYIEEKNGSGGFFVSNRLFGLEKITTTQNDIFIFTTPSQQIIATGNIADEEQGKIADVNVSLYEIKSASKKRLLQSRVAPNGAYQFVLLPNMEYKLTVEKEGYQSDEMRFSTFDHEEKGNYKLDFTMKQLDAGNKTMASNTPVFTEGNTSYPQKNNPPTRVTPTPKKETVIINTSPTPPPPVSETRRNTISKSNSTPTYTGIYYKVQLTVVIDFYPNHSMFREVKNMGRLDTEYLADKNWHRVLLADFFSLREAREAMLKAQQLGFFDAFLVKYKNGRRKTP